MTSLTSTESKYTGWAIALALIATIFFYLIYQFLFLLIVYSYASYDRSFATGLGALLLLVIGSNVLASMSSMIVTHKVFPKADRAGLFYGVATTLALLTCFGVAKELNQEDGNWVPMVVQIITLVLSVLAMRVVLLF